MRGAEYIVLRRTTNRHLYNYAGNNPVRYIDPDGRLQKIAGNEFIFLPKRKSDGTLKYEVFLTKEDKIISVLYGFLCANDGTKIEARYTSDDAISLGDTYDCHGYTFTNGAFWINNDQVDKILEGDGYQKKWLPERGDVLIQRDVNGDVFHSAKVLLYDRQANQVFVEEAMGTVVFTYKNGEQGKTRYKWYTIDRNRDSFYARPEDKILDEMPLYTMEIFNNE